MVQTGSGWLLLSRRPEEVTADMYRKTIRSGHITQQEFPLATLMERVRSSKDKEVNFATARDSVRPTAHWGGGLVSTIVPIPEGHRNLTICVGGPADRLEHKLDKISTALHLARERISESLAQRTA
jgi:DNA-binding IclR family transcriptional regulator